MDDLAVGDGVNRLAPNAAVLVLRAVGVRQPARVARSALDRHADVVREQLRSGLPVRRAMHLPELSGTKIAHRAPEPVVGLRCRIRVRHQRGLNHTRIGGRVRPDANADRERSRRNREYVVFVLRPLAPVGSGERGSAACYDHTAVEVRNPDGEAGPLLTDRDGVYLRRYCGRVRSRGPCRYSISSAVAKSARYTGTAAAAKPICGRETASDKSGRCRFEPANSFSQVRAHRLLRRAITVRYAPRSILNQIASQHISLRSAWRQRSLCRPDCGMSPRSRIRCCAASHLVSRQGWTRQGRSPRRASRDGRADDDPAVDLQSQPGICSPHDGCSRRLRRCRGVH